MTVVLCLVAHPDDETILAGGTLALLAERGAEVHYACATRGDGGELGEPPVATRETIGGAREAEMVCAVGKLGGRSLTFLGYTDPPAGPGPDDVFAFDADPVMLAGQVTLMARQVGARAIVTHGSNGEYGHPAHVLVHRAARVAVESFGESAPGLYSFAATFPGHPRPRLANADDPADFVFDITSVFGKKLAAAGCHRSQHALFVRRRSQEEGRPMALREVLMTVESLRRQWVGERDLGQDEFERALSQLPRL